jgi:hypothetical protein
MPGPGCIKKIYFSPEKQVARNDCEAFSRPQAADYKRIFLLLFTLAWRMLGSVYSRTALAKRPMRHKRFQP